MYRSSSECHSSNWDLLLVRKICRRALEEVGVDCRNASLAPFEDGSPNRGYEYRLAVWLILDTYDRGVLSVKLKRLSIRECNGRTNVR